MLARLTPLLSLLLLFLPQPLLAQTKRPLADLIPEKMVGYAEVRQPKELAKEVAALFKDSAFGNVPFSLAKIRAKYETALGGRQFEELLIPGMMLAPEVLNEAGRVEGVAAALYSLNFAAEPEYVVLVRPGKSNAPAFLMRMFLVSTRCVPLKKIEGVQSYGMPYGFGGFGGVEDPFPRKFDEKQSERFPRPKIEEKKIERFPRLRPDPRPQPLPGGLRPVIHQRVVQPGVIGGPPAQFRGPVFAMLPDLLVFGSQKAVKGVILRSKGKANGKSLVQSEQYQKASKEFGKQSGIFAFLDMKQYVRTYSEMLANMGPDGAIGVQMFNTLINPKSMPAAAYHVTLNKGALAYRTITYLNPKEKNPMIELWPTTPPDPAILHYAPADAIVAAAMSNRGGKGRWQKFLRLADEVATTFPQQQGPLPSEYLKKMGQRFKIDLGKEVFDKITDVGLAVGDPLSAPVKRIVQQGPGFRSERSGPEVPVLIVIQTTDEKSAKSIMEKLLPAVIGEMVPGAAPKAAKVQGHTIHTVKTGQFDATSWSYGRHKNVIVMGPYSDPVAKALSSGQAKKGWLAASAGKLTNVKGSTVFAVIKPFSSIISMFATTRSQGFSQRKVDKIAPPVPLPRPVPKADRLLPPPPPGAVIFLPAQPQVKQEVVVPSKSEKKFRADLQKLLKNEPPLYFQYKKSKDRLVQEISVADLQAMVPKLTDFLVDQYFLSMARRYDPFFGSDVKFLLKKQDNLTANDPKDVVRQNSHHKVYEVKMKAGRQYIIDMTARFDTYLRLEDAAGNQLRQDDDGGAGLNSRIRHRATRSGSYRIIATSLGRALGPFNVTVREVEE